MANKMEQTYRYKCFTIFRTDPNHWGIGVDTGRGYATRAGLWNFNTIKEAKEYISTIMPD